MVISKAYLFQCLHFYFITIELVKQRKIVEQK